MQPIIMFDLFFLPFRVIQIFTDFTFTDFEDFLPLISLVVGVIGVSFIRRGEREKVSGAMLVLMALFSLWPVLPNFGLFFMAREVQWKCGAWPQVMIDDPKNLYGGVTPRYDALFHLTAYLEAFSGAWMIVFFALYYKVSARFSLWQKRLIIGLTVLALFAFLIDPGNLYAWWLD